MAPLLIRPRKPSQLEGRVSQAQLPEQQAPWVSTTTGAPPLLQQARLTAGGLWV